MNALILAGGRSRRMHGARKAFLRLGDETFIERILRMLRPHFDVLHIVTNEPDLYERFDARVVPDVNEGVGPLMGIYSGLSASGSEMNFVTAADTPLLKEGLIRRLMEIGEDCDALVPLWKGEVEPLCAVYSRRCLPAIRSVLGPGQDLAENAARIIAFFPLVRSCFVEESAVRKVDPEGLSFVNVNTPADYDALRALHAAGPGGQKD